MIVVSVCNTIYEFGFSRKILIIDKHTSLIVLKQGNAIVQNTKRSKISNKRGKHENNGNGSDEKKNIGRHYGSELCVQKSLTIQVNTYKLE